MAALTLIEAIQLKKELRRAVLGAVVETLRNGLTSKMEKASPALLHELEDRLRQLRLLIDRSDVDDQLQLVINQEGIHILDKVIEFHL